jgi:hypothetical protein
MRTCFILNSKSAEPYYLPIAFVGLGGRKVCL